jgi:hypothetical protein
MSFRTLTQSENKYWLAGVLDAACILYDGVVAVKTRDSYVRQTLKEHIGGSLAEPSRWTCRSPAAQRRLLRWWLEHTQNPDRLPEIKSALYDIDNRDSAPEGDL